MNVDNNEHVLVGISAIEFEEATQGTFYPQTVSQSRSSDQSHSIVRLIPFVVQIAPFLTILTKSSRNWFGHLLVQLISNIFVCTYLSPVKCTKNSLPCISVVPGSHKPHNSAYSAPHTRPPSTKTSISSLPSRIVPRRVKGEVSPCKILLLLRFGNPAR